MIKEYKNILWASLVMIAALGCTRQIDRPDSQVGVPFTINVEAPMEVTKTINNGLNTEFVDGDAVNLFHTESEQESYINDGAFSFVSDNKFAGSIAEASLPQEEKSYVWYAFYPYSSYTKTPAGTGDNDFSRIVIGSASNSMQVQTGNNSMSHLAGTYLPMYGKCSTTGTESPDITMSHLSSVIEVEVTNNTGDPVSVASVRFAAQESLVGQFYMNLTTNPVTYINRAGNVSNVANLSVFRVEDGSENILTGGEEISNGESAKFYLAVKPFEAKSGSSLSLMVNGYSKTITMTKDVKFEAGKIKNVKFSLEGTPTVTSVNQVNSLKDGSFVYVEGLIVADNEANFILYDGDGYILVYDKGIEVSNIGQRVKVSGVKSTYLGLPEITVPKVQWVSTCNEIERPDPVVYTSETLDNAIVTSIHYFKASGTLLGDGKYYNLIIDENGERGICHYGGHRQYAMDNYVGKNVEVCGYGYGIINRGGVEYLNTIFTSIKVADIHVLSIADAKASEDGAIITTEGVVVAQFTRGLLISDGENVMEVRHFGLSSVGASSVKLGDRIQVTGPKRQLYGHPEIATTQGITILSSGNSFTHPEPSVYTEENFSSLLANPVGYIKVQGVYTPNTGRIVIVGDDCLVDLADPVGIDLSEHSGESVTVLGYANGSLLDVHSNKPCVYVIATSIEFTSN